MSHFQKCASSLFPFFLLIKKMFCFQRAVQVKILHSRLFSFKYHPKFKWLKWEEATNMDSLMIMTAVRRCRANMVHPSKSDYLKHMEKYGIKKDVCLLFYVNC